MRKSFKLIGNLTRREVSKCPCYGFGARLDPMKAIAKVLAVCGAVLAKRQNILMDDRRIDTDFGS